MALPSVKPIPVYINYGKEAFLKTYDLFRAFLKTFPYSQLERNTQAARPAGIIVSPRNNSAIPWCNISLALLYAYKGFPLSIIWDDLPFLDPEWELQKTLVQNVLDEVCERVPMNQITVSALDDSALDDADYAEITRLAAANALWNVRQIVPCDRLEEYTTLSKACMNENAPKLKTLYSRYTFDHCVHQSFVNNNGGLHRWFGANNGIRMSCLDVCLGAGLVGLNHVAGYHTDLPPLLTPGRTYLFHDPLERDLAISEAQKEVALRQQGKDMRKSQLVSLDAEPLIDHVDVVMPLNIFWDAAALYRNRFFETPYHWLMETIDFILKHTKAKLAVRQHPHERHFAAYGTGSNLGASLKQTFGHDPRFMFFSCDDRINTYRLLEKAQVVLPYTSTVGIEAALMGKCVIIESCVYYGNQPFVRKAESKAHYFKEIKAACESAVTYSPDLLSGSSKEDGWLLYFLLNRCEGITSEFGLDPSDVQRWAPKGFEALVEDDTLMTALEALATGTPYAYLNGKKVLRHLKARSRKVIEWSVETDSHVKETMRDLLERINRGQYQEALDLLQHSASCPDYLYSYPEAYLLAKLNRLKDSQKALERLLTNKPDHERGNQLSDELELHLLSPCPIEASLLGRD
ncbi:MAG: hypothetical protein SWQ30_01475 [Thermodesulfobacteriota bacterium]|nr:hypothetical protein [Thermodesulfobacteriota bacterium]